MAKIAGNLVPEDDYTHPLGPEPNFNESMYFNFFDREQSIGGFLRLGNRANEGNAEMTVAIYLPNERVLFMFKRPKIENNDAFDAGGCRFEVLSGYFDGLTFHRVVPNFVIQGGSPGANEYAGDGPYTRDELTARPHLRGTVGISTRGRDTGDAQIFVNLVDNVRLDHNYTIFAEVSAGMDVVDAVLEGSTIERITLHGR